MKFVNMKLVFATNNVHKFEEASKIASSAFEIISLKELNFSEEIPEDYETLEENALQKAKFIYDKFQINCFADDTGLEVEALDGQPGVYSARYAAVAGEHPNFQQNINKLLNKLKGETNRNAKFRTVVALIINGKEFLFEGSIYGKIVMENHGSNGFGYDPIFLPNGYNKTFGELSDIEKNKISHRAIALQKLFEFLNTKKI